MRVHVWTGHIIYFWQGWNCIRVESLVRQIVFLKKTCVFKNICIFFLFFGRAGIAAASNRWCGRLFFKKHVFFFLVGLELQPRRIAGVAV